MSEIVVKATVKNIVTLHKEDSKRHQLATLVQSPDPYLEDYIHNMLKTNLVEVTMRTGTAQCIENYDEAIQDVLKGLAKKLGVEPAQKKSS